MTDAQIFAELAAAPPGAYDLLAGLPKWKRFLNWAWPTKRYGWLTVEKDEDGSTAIMWTTEKNEHSAFSTAFCLNVTKSGELKYYMESALSMHIKWGFGRGGEAELRAAVAAARWMHSKLCHPQQNAPVRAAIA